MPAKAGMPLKSEMASTAAGTMASLLMSSAIGLLE
jgi:hypothetical protein